MIFGPWCQQESGDRADALGVASKAGDESASLRGRHPALLRVVRIREHLAPPGRGPPGGATAGFAVDGRESPSG